MEILLVLVALIAIGFIIWRALRAETPASTDKFSDGPDDRTPPAAR